MRMERTLALSVAAGAALLLFTGVASAETGSVHTGEEIELLRQLLEFINTFIEELNAPLSDTQG